MTGPMKDGAIEGPTTLKLGNKASEDVRSELVHGVKRRLPRAVTPDGQLAEQVVAAYDNRSAKNRMELIGIDIDAVMATVSQCVVKLACFITFIFYQNPRRKLWTPLGGWALIDPQERLKTVSKEDAQRLREDSLRLKEERREEVQIVSDAQVTLRPKVKTEASEEDDSIVAGFNPSFHSSIIKEPPVAGKITGAALKNALKKVLPGSSVLNQSMEGLKPAPGDRVG